MKGEPLPANDQVARYCKPSTVSNDSPLASAFELRDNDKGLSVNWLECLDQPDIATAIEQVRKTFTEKGFSLRPKDRFAVLNVGAIKTAVQAGAGLSLQVLHEPVDDDVSQ